MKLGTLFLLIASSFACMAFRWQGAAWILTAVSASFVLVAAAYLGLGPGIFGKRPDGSMAPGSILLLLPYLLFVWGTWRLLRLVRRASPFDELVPGVIIGRRLFPNEYPQAVEHVLDLTCEFPEFRQVRRSRGYLSFPILDGHAPRLDDLLQLLKSLDRLDGTLYIHCAEGHGRAGLVAAAILLFKGAAPDADEAVRLVRAKREGVLLTAAQEKLLVQVTKACERDR